MARSRPKMDLGPESEQLHVPVADLLQSQQRIEHAFSAYYHRPYLGL